MAKESTTQRRLRQAGRLSKNGTLFASTVILFLLSLGLVFFGFIGYVSRVSLSSEFEKTGSQNIDVIFMVLDQSDNDEGQLPKLKKDLAELEAKYNKEKTDEQWKGWLSPEFKAFFESLSDLQNMISAEAGQFTTDFYIKVQGIDMSRPSFESIQTLAVVYFVDTVAPEVRKRFSELWNPKVQAYRVTIFHFATKIGGTLDILEVAYNSKRAELQNQINEIERRAESAVKKPLVTDQQRAIIRSYKKALFGWGGTILTWPTIVSTMIVTLAMGLLGSIVSFMGTAMTHPQTYRFSELFRRSILGITAALGIFLFAGSGLLVLTAQSGKPVGAGSIELSPYFVAFLAFISGFLADDAAARLTRAGRAIFQADQKGAGLAHATRQAAAKS